jgi:hypothetical protein
LRRNFQCQFIRIRKTRKLRFRIERGLRIGQRFGIERRLWEQRRIWRFRFLWRQWRLGFRRIGIAPMDWQ